MTRRFSLAAAALVLSLGAARADDGFRAAAAVSDPARRAEAVLPYLDAGDPALYARVLDVWSGCGAPALSVVRSLVDDETRTDRANFLDPLCRAAGKDATAELARLLGAEAAFWDNLGLNLDEPAKVAPARVHFLVELLRRLDARGYRDERGLVRAVRDRFADQPVLRECGGTVLSAANAVLARR